MDGSQLSFSRRCLSNESNADQPQLQFYCGKAAKTASAVMFAKVIAMVESIEQRLVDDYTYHCEYVGKLRHNVVDYGRLPRLYLVLYDVQDKAGQFLQPAAIQAEADRLGVECAALLADNTGHQSTQPTTVDPIALARSMLAGGLQSQLGGQAEGVVLKHHNYRHVRYRGEWRDGVLEQKEAVVELVDKKLKFVTEQFRESRSIPRDRAELTPTAFLRWIGWQYSTTARWRKGVQRLRDKQDVVYDGGWSEAEKAVYVERLNADLDADLMEEYGMVVRSYISAEFHEFAKVHERVARNPTSARQASAELQNDAIFRQLAEPNWHQHMDVYLQVVCESARAGLQMEVLIAEANV